MQQITRRDLVDLLDRKYATAPYAANQTRAALSQMMNWLVEREVLEISPLVGAKPRRLAPPRKRSLTDDELRALWMPARASDERASEPMEDPLRLVQLLGIDYLPTAPVTTRR